MKYKTKIWMCIIAVAGIVLGRFINRALSNYVGSDASNVVVSGAVAIVFCVILLSIAMSNFTTAIVLFIMVIPLIISAIGLYLKNMDLVGVGILSIFIIYPILIKLIPKFKRGK